MIEFRMALPTGVFSRLPKLPGNLVTLPAWSRYRTAERIGFNGTGIDNRRCFRINHFDINDQISFILFIAGRKTGKFNRTAAAVGVFLKSGNSGQN